MYHTRQVAPKISKYMLSTKIHIGWEKSMWVERLNEYINYETYKIKR